MSMGETGITSDPTSDATSAGPAPEPELPLVAIIGRPNVGKSTLFNKLTQSRRAIVGDEPGITRDRLYGRSEWGGLTFRIVDTGGIVPDEREIIPANILLQTQAAISEASPILLLLDPL